LAAFSKFKLELSNRHTALLAALAFGRAVSATFVNDVTHMVGQKAQARLKRIGTCRQKVAQVLMGDETFPRILDWQSLRAKGHSPGVAICESGLIRGVKVVRNQARDLGTLFKGVVGKGFQPQYFLSDFDVHFPKIVSQAVEGIRLLKDFVHAERIIGRCFEMAIRQVTLKVPEGTSSKERQKQRDLKRRLLRKRLDPVRALFLKAFCFEQVFDPLIFDIRLVLARTISFRWLLGMGWRFHPASLLQNACFGCTFVGRLATVSK
jgi:hypothetical protein